jgi:hypothetical protein
VIRRRVTYSCDSCGGDCYVRKQRAAEIREVLRKREEGWRQAARLLAESHALGISPE